jgi:chromosome partitioning protein
MAAIWTREKPMRYAVWNNKGGVGKSFLSFVLATEIAHDRNIPVVLVDMCPQANLSEIVLGGNGIGSDRLDKFIKDRKTIGGYFDSRINSPHSKTGKELDFLLDARLINENLPKGIYLIAGDPSLELQAQVINQISSQTLPVDSWKNVHKWVADLVDECSKKLGPETMVFVDCNPSFSAYTELSMVSSDALIVPCSSDGSSARAIDNVGSLLYGITTGADYGAANFSGRAKQFSIHLPSVHSVVLNDQPNITRRRARRLVPCSMKLSAELKRSRGQRRIILQMTGHTSKMSPTAIQSRLCARTRAFPSTH